MKRIQEGSRNGAFYADEAKVRVNAGNFQGALDILDLAEKNGCILDSTLNGIRAKLCNKFSKEEEWPDKR